MKLTGTLLFLGMALTACGGDGGADQGTDPSSPSSDKPEVSSTESPCEDVATTKGAKVKPGKKFWTKQRQESAQPMPLPDPGSRTPKVPGGDGASDGAPSPSPLEDCD